MEKKYNAGSIGGWGKMEPAFLQLGGLLLHVDANLTRFDYRAFFMYSLIPVDYTFTIIQHYSTHSFPNSPPER
jgi:hypothetical protein